MPKTIAITYTCSLCPKNQIPMTEAEVSTFRFQEGGRTFEQFFCAKHGADVRKGAEPVTVPQESPSATTSNPTKKGRISELREWAAGKKIELGPGRQKTSIIEQFEKETGTSYWL